MTMVTCEKCASEFELPSRPVKVTTLRVLCPSCLAEHEARKRTRGAASSRESLPLPGDRTRKAAPPNDTANGSVPSAAGSLAMREIGGRKARPASRLTAVPRDPRPENARSTAPPNAVVDRASVAVLRQRAKRTTLLGFGAVLVLGIIAGVVMWRVLDVRRTDAAAEEARIQAQEEVYQKIMGADAAIEEEARAVVAFAEREDIQAIWKADGRAPDLVSHLAKVKTGLDLNDERRELLRRLEELEVQADGMAATSAEELARLARDLEAMVPKAVVVGEDFSLRLRERLKAVSDARSGKLIEEAREAARDLSGPEAGRAALVRYGTAEEEIQKELDAAHKAWKANPSDEALLEEKDQLAGLYQLVIQESDQLGERVYTEEFVEATPWVDLLSGERSGEWIAPAVAGFSHSIENGVMHVVGPDAESRVDGILSIGDREKWRDFVLEFEITLLKGQTDLFLRVGRSVENVESIPLSLEDSEAPLPANEPISVEIAFKGSQWNFYAHSENYDPGEVMVFDVRWVSQRRGAVAFGVPSGAEFRLSKVRIKVLR